MKQSRTLEELQSLVSDGDVHAFYVSKYWKSKRKEILERDHYECQRCKGTFIIESKPIKHITITKATCVHHIVPLKDNFNLALVNDNLVSLCFNCHEIVEERAGGFKAHWFKHKKKPLTDEKW